jgi:hypothetical protein
VRWNREWKAAADKFQDLEEERLDFTKSSLWQFANIASTVCVSDDASCEKIRLSLEGMDVEQDITTFIREFGTGQKIPDAPKYINFCRGDLTDSLSEISFEDDNYSVAQFPRDINPAFRTSSPQPSTYESHHDPNSALANNLAHREQHTNASDTANTSAPSPSPGLINTSPSSPGFAHIPASQRPMCMDQRYLPSQRHAIPGKSDAGLAMVHQVAPSMRINPPPLSDGSSSTTHHVSTQSPRVSRGSSYEHQGIAQVTAGGGIEHYNAPGTHRQHERGGAVHPVASPLVNNRQGMVPHGGLPLAISQPANSLSTTVSNDSYHTDSPAIIPNTSPDSERDHLSPLAASPSKGAHGELSSNIATLSASDVARGGKEPLMRPEPCSTNPFPQTAGSEQKPPQIQTQSQAQSQPQPHVLVHDMQVAKVKSGFSRNHSPFRRKSTKDLANQLLITSPRTTWSHDGANTATSVPQQEPNQPTELRPTVGTSAIHERSTSPDHIDANASLALNIGRNVFPVTTKDLKYSSTHADTSLNQDDSDPIAMALAKLKGGDNPGAQSSTRVSADHYHGITTPAPGATGAVGGGLERSSQPSRLGPSLETTGTPPPSYDFTPTSISTLTAAIAPNATLPGSALAPLPHLAMGHASGSVPVQRLGVPPPAVTSRAMREATKKVTDQSRHIFGQAPAAAISPSRPGTRGNDISGIGSPSIRRSTSPRQSSVDDGPKRQYGTPAPSHHNAKVTGNGPSQYRSVPASLNGNSTTHSNPISTSPVNNLPPNRHSHYRASSAHDMARAASPASFRGLDVESIGGTPDLDITTQLASDDDGHGSHRGRRPGTSNSSRPISPYTNQAQAGSLRQRSRSVVDPSRQYTRDGHPILHFARAMYMYQAAIPQELGFSKGDILAVLGHQDDGWWRAEVHGPNSTGQNGLVPSNYLQPC